MQNTSGRGREERDRHRTAPDWLSAPGRCDSDMRRVCGVRCTGGGANHVVAASGAELGRVSRLWVGAEVVVIAPGRQHRQEIPASVAQSAERQSHNLKVESSNLPWSIVLFFLSLSFSLSHMCVYAFFFFLSLLLSFYLLARRYREEGGPVFETHTHRKKRP